jgi:hypothetical protein
VLARGFNSGVCAAALCVGGRWPPENAHPRIQGEFLCPLCNVCCEVASAGFLAFTAGACRCRGAAGGDCDRSGDASVGSGGRRGSAVIWCSYSSWSSRGSTWMTTGSGGRSDRAQSRPTRRIPRQRSRRRARGSEVAADRAHSPARSTLRAGSRSASAWRDGVWCTRR